MVRKLLLASALLIAAPALAQPPAQVALVEGDAAAGYRVLGAVVVDLPASAASAVLPKAQLDAQLRAEAGKLGAEAVILVTYETTPARHRATGVAVRYAATQMAAASPPPVAPVVAPIVAPTTPTVTLPAPLPPPSPPPPAAVPATVAPAPAIAHALAADQVLLTDSDFAGRKYVSLGPVSATVHQKTLIMKMSEQEQTQQALRAAAFAMGADAVIKVKYKFTNGMFSKEGDTGSGIAIRFE